MENYQNVRLNEKYLKEIKSLSLIYFNSTDVRIFGSRADLNKKGGDIDIYIKTDKSEGILKRKLSFLREFQKKFGSQKIDLIVEYQGSRKKNIYSEAKKKGIMI